MMYPTNLGTKPIDRFLQTREEVEYWAAKFTFLLGDYEHGKEHNYPNIDALEAEMIEARSALIEWAVEFNNVWGKQ